MRATWLISLIVLTACSLNIDNGGTNFQCNPDGTCPPNQECIDMVCVPSDPLPPACSSAISSGGFHTCAVREDGTVWCFGRNDFGQLGDDSIIDRDTPVQVVMVKDALEVGAGETYSCALDKTGHVYCWGNNSAGQLGDTRTTSSRTPVQAAVEDVKHLSAGATHACVLKADNSVVCWGGNDDGQLGDGSMTDRGTPSAVALPGPARAVSAGNDITCAVLMDNTAQCWGENNEGDLGVGDTLPHPRPVAVVDVTNVTAVSAGDDHTCFLNAEGFVYCAGLNDEGQLGNGSLGVSNRPVLSQVPAGVVAISAGAVHTCALDSARNVWCWGFDGDGRLMDGLSSRRTTPVRAIVEDTVSVSAGSEHTCALDAGGAIRCAGFNRRGQLGDGRAETRGAPVEVQGVTNAVLVAAGARHSCAAQQDGKVLCWGENDNGETGTGNFTAAVTTPHDVVGISKPKMMVAGNEHTCVLLEDNTTYCWGFNPDGRIGDGTTQSSSQPRGVKNILGPPTAISIGDATSFALLNGGARCWGGPFGTMPQTIANIAGITAGGGHVCTLEPDKTVRCYGDNDFWQLGDGTNSYAPAPGVVAKNVADAVEVRARGDQTCARLGDGSIKCWGFNDSGRLGTGPTYGNQTMPAPVMGMSNAMKFAMGYDASCAIKADGSLWCWGANYFGGVGDGSYESKTAAVQLLGLNNVKDVASGGAHSCAIDANGHVLCWGLGSSGQLGNGIRHIGRPVGVQMSCP